MARRYDGRVRDQLVAMQLTWEQCKGSSTVLSTYPANRCVEEIGVSLLRFVACGIFQIGTLQRCRGVMVWYSTQAMCRDAKPLAMQ